MPYVGELIREEEGYRREKEYDIQNSTFTFSKMEVKLYGKAYFFKRISFRHAVECYKKPYLKVQILPNNF